MERLDGVGPDQVQRLGEVDAEAWSLLNSFETHCNKRIHLNQKAPLHGTLALTRSMEYLSTH